MRKTYIKKIKVNLAYAAGIGLLTLIGLGIGKIVCNYSTIKQPTYPAVKKSPLEETNIFGLDR